MATRKVSGINVRCMTPDGKWVSGGIQDIYASGRMTVANGTTKYDCKETGGLFNATTHAGILLARFISIRTDQTITVYLVSVTGGAAASCGDAIIMTAAGSPYEIELEVTNVLITNASGSTAYVDIFYN